MSDVNANDLRKINDIEDVLPVYSGAGNDMMAGIEVELAYFDPESPNLTPMTVPQNKVVKNATNSECSGEFARNEPTSEMLEIGSRPGKPEDLNAIIDDTNRKIACLSKKAADIGLKRSYFQDLPNITAEQLLQNVVPVERYQAFFAPPRADMTDIAAYFSVCKSNQVSVSYKNPDHLFENIRRLYALAPFLFMITDNGSGFDQGTPFSGHAGMKHRKALADKGGCPDYLFTAQTGQDYIVEHIHHVMRNPLFVYYDEEGKLTRLPSGSWETFNSLKNKGLNTATNYYFSQTILWPDVKIAALKDEHENVSGHRYEARMFGVGMHQHVSAMLIVSALAFNPVFADKTDHLLKQYGFDFNTPEEAKPHLSNAYDASRNHNGQFLDIPYGTGSMQEFAKDFANLLEQTYLASPLENHLNPILSICYNGFTDAKVNRALFGTLEEAINFQRNYDPSIFETTNFCAHTLFEKELSGYSESHSCCKI